MVEEHVYRRTAEVKAGGSAKDGELPELKRFCEQAGAPACETA